MKGQFFLLGAFMLIALFFIGLQFGKPLLQTRSGDLHYIHENVERELPRALNLGINESRPVEVLSNFTRYLKESLYFVNFSALWIVTENIDFDMSSPYTLNVTAGNFLGYEVTVNITIGTVSSNVTVPDNQTNSTTFEIAVIGIDPGTFDMNVSFDGTSKAMEGVVLNKHNLYALVKLQRGNDFVKEELVEPTS